MSGGAPVRWIVDTLDTGSAIIGAHADAEPEFGRRVGGELHRIGRAVRIGDFLAIPDTVREDVTGLVNVMGERIDSMRFETGETDTIIPAASRELMRTGLPLSLPPGAEVRWGNLEPIETFGAVEGRIQTLTNRGQFRFTLYDTLHDKGVSCYLAPAYKDIMRDAWGRLALVEGVISRDPISGRPMTVRQVQAIHLLEEGERDGWRRARGIAPPTNDISPEDAIRALRDAE
jgi:hypothetical protein